MDSPRTAPSAGSDRRYRRIQYAVATVACFVTGAASWGAWSEACLQEEAEFEAVAAEVAYDIAAHLAHLEHELFASRALLESSSHVTPHEWERFVESAARNLPESGGTGIALIERVPADQLEPWLERWNDEDGVERRVFDNESIGDGSYEDLCVIRFHAPSEFNASAIGLNVASLRQSREALRRSARIDGVAVAEAFPLAQLEDEDAVATAMYLPVYTNAEIVHWTDGEALAPWRPSPQQGFAHPPHHPPPHELSPHHRGPHPHPAHPHHAHHRGAEDQHAAAPRPTVSSGNGTAPSSAPLRRGEPLENYWTHRFGGAGSAFAPSWERVRGWVAIPVLYSDLIGSTLAGLEDTHLLVRDGDLLVHAPDAALASAGTRRSVNQIPFAGRELQLELVAPSAPLTTGLVPAARAFARWGASGGVIFLLVGLAFRSSRRAEALELQVEADHEYKRLLESEAARLGSIGAWQLDVERQRVAWSDEVCRIHDLPVGHRPTLDEAISFYAEESRPIIQECVRRAIEEFVPWDVELEMRSAHGRRFWARSMGRADVVDGRTVRVFGSFQDVSERRDRCSRSEPANSRPRGSRPRRPTTRRASSSPT